MRQQQARRERRERYVIFGAVGVIVVLIAAGAAWGITRQRAADNQPPALPKAVSGQRTTQPPWDLPADPVAGAERVGLRVEPMEGTAKHFHAHLDVLVDGEAVPVPANIGIHPSGTAMSELHTHDQRGVLHIEAPSADRRYVLGQLFAEWDVRLDQNHLGGLAADQANGLRAYVDGKLYRGNPAAIELTAHRQIALVYGPKDAKVDVPASYNFSPGE
ncbi:MAG: hypothetical protein GEV03_13880 [Streptosporangiales bacterium]|nr:hypothetical protein [Streptosporangiales bacterium]